MATSSIDNKVALGSAIAGDAIARALIETFFEKSALSLDESRTVLDCALRNLSFHNQADDAREAVDIVNEGQKVRG